MPNPTTNNKERCCKGCKAKPAREGVVGTPWCGYLGNCLCHNKQTLKKSLHSPSQSEQTVQEAVEAYRRFCRDNVYVCAYCDHCLEEDAIVDFFTKALTTAEKRGEQRERERLLKEINYETDVVQFRANELHVFARSVIDTVIVTQNGKRYEISLATLNDKD